MQNDPTAAKALFEGAPHTPPYVAEMTVMPLEEVASVDNGQQSGEKIPMSEPEADGDIEGDGEPVIDTRAVTTVAETHALDDVLCDGDVDGDTLTVTHALVETEGETEPDGEGDGEGETEVDTDTDGDDEPVPPTDKHMFEANHCCASGDPHQT